MTDIEVLRTTLKSSNDFDIPNLSDPSDIDTLEKEVHIPSRFNKKKANIYMLIHAVKEC